MNFREIAFGIGGRWMIQPKLTLDVGVGWMIDRRFEFEDRDLLLNGDAPPRYNVSLRGAF